MALHAVAIMPLVMAVVTIVAGVGIERGIGSGSIEIVYNER
jgi:hypothetical protein